MSTYLAHGATTSEIAKYKRIDGNDVFSLAEYDSEVLEEPMRHFMHMHDEYEFVIPLKTVPLLYYQKANYIGEVGFVYPVNPNVEHGLEFDMASSSVIDITVDRNYMESLKKRLGFENDFFYSRFPCKRSLMEIIYLYQDECRREDKDEAKINRLIDAIISSLIEDGLTSPRDTRRPEKHYGKNIRSTLIYMNEHYREPELTISFLAKQNGYSLTYFSKAFKAYMHDTPIAHLNRLRTSAARALLKDKTLTLEKIALMVGYRNLSTFTEAFKHLLKMTPSQYRKVYC
ncbi:MAG: helix-turn-helix transcriptional regulator [Bacilli bacterium]|nr:helix-turn-helix transcriptional regulator [Bacilli bacterium]